MIKIKTGRFTEAVEIVKVKRAAPPNTAALIIRFTNRRRALWRNTQSLHQLDKIVNPADGPMRVIVELVGDPAPPRIEATGRDTGSRLPKDALGNAQLVG